MVLGLAMLNKKALAGSSSTKTFVEDVFSPYIYTGQVDFVDNGIDLSGKGGLVWIKARSGTSGSSDHALFDTARGINSGYLSSNTNIGASNVSTDLTAFNNNGFSLGDPTVTNSYIVNENTRRYASWTFRKQPKFFDIVTYTGDGFQGKSISHNLGSVPGMIIIKRTDTTGDWAVWHRSGINTDGTFFVPLNSTAAYSNRGQGNVFGTSSSSYTPTSTAFQIGDAVVVNDSGGTYVAYLFAHDAGGFGEAGTDNVISCGSFTTDGSGNATVNLGYEPQYILWKNADAIASWNIFDTTRGFSNGASGDFLLYADLADAESPTNSGNPTAIGFTAAQAVSNTYIYMAIRRPMKVPTDATTVFNSIARTGTGANATVSSGFVTDTVIEGRRTGTTAGSKFGAWNRLRGTGYNITNTTAAEVAGGTTIIQANPWDVMDGYKVGTTSVLTNASASTFINWMFKRATGFHDVVCYTGTGSATTVAHNLGVVPELMIVKRRDSTGSFGVYSATLGATQALALNTTAATAASLTFWNDTAPTSSVLTVGTNASYNASGGTYVALLFATCAGVSKVGSYTGNGTTQTIDCEFTAGARFVMIKRTDSTGSWYVWDTSRGIIAGNDPYLVLNTTAAEVTNTDYIDAVSSGFELSSTAPADINASGGSYIFLAIA